MAASPVLQVANSALRVHAYESEFSNRWSALANDLDIRPSCQWEPLEDDLYPPAVLPSPPDSDSISRQSHHQWGQPRPGAPIYSSEPERCGHWQPCHGDESKSDWECVSVPPAVQRCETPSRLELLEMGYLSTTGKSDSDSGTQPASGWATVTAGLRAEAAKAVVTTAGRRAKQPRRRVSSRSDGSTAARATDSWTALPPTGGRASSHRLSQNPPRRSSMSAAAAVVKETQSQTAQQILSERNATGSLSASHDPD